MLWASKMRDAPRLKISQVPFWPAGIFSGIHEGITVKFDRPPAGLALKKVS